MTHVTSVVCHMSI